MNIAIASDHAGKALKDFLRNNLKSHMIEDLGTKGPDSVDYPDFAEKACAAVVAGKADRGILICGTGLGMSIAANKIPGIRAAHCESIFTARMAAEHNAANILCLGERVTGAAHALEMVEAWLGAEFGGIGCDAGVKARHQRRIDKISALEKK